MMSSFILAGALTFGQPVGDILPSKDAPRYIAKALYKDSEFQTTVSRVEKLYLKLDNYPELAYIGIIGRFVVERRVTYAWRF